MRIPSCLLSVILSLLLLLQAARAEAAPKKTAADFLVQSLQDVEPAFSSFQGDMYAGLLPLAEDNNDTEFMFWLFVPHHQSVPDTMVLWLNGGPGCSSILGGVLVENSPVHLGAHPAGTCCMDPNDKLRANPYSWTKATTMLYVEMPTGTGFSNGGRKPRNEKDVGRDMYGFLQSFYGVFPELRTRRLSLFGESYAGYFVPSIAHRIAVENNKHKQNVVSIPLEGIGVGNGWMDASVQGPAVIDYAWWHGMIDHYTRDAFHSQWHRCYVLNKDEQAPFHSFTTPDECGIMGAVLDAAGQGVLPNGRTPNTYDVTTFDPYAVIGSHNSTLTRFMNNPAVKKALHAPNDIEWSGCIKGGGRRRLQQLEGLLSHDQPTSMMPYVAELMDRWNIRVLIYNGDLDMSCNAQGTEKLLNNMQWSGSRAWKVAGRGIWMTNNTVAGYVKKYANLVFLVVKNSGHLVPLNQPLPALDLVERFLRNVPFLDIPLPSFVLSETSDIVPSTQSPTSLVEEETVNRLCDDEDDSEMWLRILDQVVLAVVCFFAGAIAAHSWRRKGYETVPSGNGARH